MNNSDLLLSISFGLILLGIGFLVFDFFIVKMIKKMPPDSEYVPEKKAFERASLFHREVVSHKFRRGGIYIISLGIILLGITVTLY